MIWSLIGFLCNLATFVIVLAIAGPKLDRALQKLIEKRRRRLLSDGHRPPLHLK